MSEVAGFSLADGLDLSGLSYAQLWLLYISVGGTTDLDGLRQQVAVDVDPYEHNMIAQALNDYFLDRGQFYPVGYRPSSMG